VQYFGVGLGALKAGGYYEREPALEHPNWPLHAKHCVDTPCWAQTPASKSPACGCHIWPWGWHFGAAINFSLNSPPVCTDNLGGWLCSGSSCRPESAFHPPLHSSCETVTIPGICGEKKSHCWRHNHLHDIALKCACLYLRQRTHFNIQPKNVLTFVKKTTPSTSTTA
jgi:hypothetical protein